MKKAALLAIGTGFAIAAGMLFTNIQSASAAQVHSSQPTMTASADYSFDNHLEIKPEPYCEPEFEQCGPHLYVYGEGVSTFGDAPFPDVTCSLRSSTGRSIALTSYGIPGCTYGNSPTVEAETPTATGIPNGTYTFTYTLHQGGWWN